MSVKKFINTIKNIKEQKDRMAQESVSTPTPDFSESGRHDESNWLVSYADMMTLLCGFFIMLFSMASLDAGKFEKVKESVSKQFGGQYTSPHDAFGKQMTQVLQELGVQKEAVVKSDPTGVIVIFESVLFFETLSAEVSPKGQQIVEKLVGAIKDRQKNDQKNYRIIVEGHTDARPIVGGIYPSNWELSSARASRIVRRFLEDGIAPELLVAIGYGDTRPQYPSRTPAGSWDEAALLKNRRVVLRVMDPNFESIPIAQAASSAH